MNTFFLTIGILACWFGIMANLLAVSAINKPRSGVFWNWVYRTLCDPIKGDYYCAHFPISIITICFIGVAIYQ